MTIRPRRSCLFMPGANARALEKARQLPADVVIMDLEDAVAPDAKAEARARVAAALGQGDYGGRERVVRINAEGTPWHDDDLEAVAAMDLDAVCLPKVESADAVVAVVRRLEALGAAPQVRLWAMAETPLGVLAIETIAASHPRLAVLLMGTSDLARELRAEHTPERSGFAYALGRCVMAARAYGLDIVDGVHLDLADDDGLRAVCRQARVMGFDGKSLIHPAQVDAANEVFSPTGAELDHARKVIEAYDAAARRGEGVAVVDGRLVENLHVAIARRQLALADAVAALAATAGEE